MLSEVYDVPGNRWVMGASEMEIDGVILVACYTLSAMKPDGSESNATHMDVEPLRAFLNTQPKRRRVVGVLDHGELRPMIGVHKISYSNGANRVFLQMGPAL